MNYFKLLNTAETAEFLNISAASIKNWEKHNLLSRKNGGFKEDDVIALRNKISSGEIKRLNSRANKKQAAGYLAPKNELSSVCEELKLLNISIDDLMMLISFRLFIEHSLINCSSCSSGQFRQLYKRLIEFRPEDYKTPAVIHHLRTRYKKLNSGERNLQKSFESIMTLTFPEPSLSSLPAEYDTAGSIYQAVSSRGDRAATGSFYTPPETANNMIISAVKKLGIDISKIQFIDPCCGTGQFLLSFIKNGGKVENIFGIDSDSTAAFTAATNILLQCPESETLPQIFCINSLLSDPDELPECNLTEKTGSFDLLITNPPWGAALNGRKELLKLRYPEIKSSESFSYFINRAFELVRTGGIISAVLPESITNVKRHEDVRDLIRRNAEITDLSGHGRLFKSVYTPVVTIEMLKTPEKTSSIKAKPPHCFNININSTDTKIVDKLYALPHISLRNRADWALGIVTGDNSRYISSTAAEGYESVIKGRDIQQGKITTPKQYLRFQPERFQQTAPEWKYRAPEKLVYRFISKRLIFSVDRGRRLTLNSANIIIPATDKLITENGSCFTIIELMQLFNSNLYSFIFKKRFNSVKVLRSHIEELPIIKEDLLNNHFSQKELIYIANETE